MCVTHCVPQQNISFLVLYFAGILPQLDSWRFAIQLCGVKPSYTAIKLLCSKHFIGVLFSCWWASAYKQIVVWVRLGDRCISSDLTWQVSTHFSKLVSVWKTGIAPLRYYSTQYKIWANWVQDTMREEWELWRYANSVTNQRCSYPKCGMLINNFWFVDRICEIVFMWNKAQ